MANKIHEGRNVKRFREMLGIKQEALAIDLGSDWNQKKISLLEGKEKIEPAILEEISAIMKIPVEAFQRFDEEQAINIIASTFHDSAVANTFTDGAQANFHCTFNPLDKMVELYERMIKDRDNTITMFQTIVESLKK